MHLFEASNQWANRPEDERFWNLSEMLTACKKYAASSAQATVPYRDIKVIPAGEDIVIQGQAGVPASLTHYAFGQLCARAGAPASYLRNLPAVMAAENLDYSLHHAKGGDEKAVMLLHQNGHWIVRCALTERYSRIWNFEVAQGLMGIESEGWRVPPARPSREESTNTRVATEADCLKTSLIKPGETIGPSGLYASDKDMFVFMVNESKTIQNPSDKGPLSRGFFVWNSEVGDRTLGAMSFYYDFVCGNHIVWNVSKVRELRMRHIGEIRQDAMQRLALELREYSDTSESESNGILTRAASFELGTTKEKTLEALFTFVAGKRIPLSQNLLTRAYDLALETPRYGNPNTPWAITQALTQLSQESAYADRRVEIDASAGRLLQMSF